jgi:hypothetical protein
MHKKGFWVNKLNKTSQNHIAKAMFFRRIQRTKEENST